MDEITLHSYTAYNLKIESELPLPELRGSRGEGEVTVRFGSVRGLPAPAKPGLVRAAAGEAYLSFPGLAAFLVREGREIIVDPAPKVDERWLRIGVLGPCMGTLLYQRGLLTLHASSVAVDGHAVAFVGERGWGKSTMAAAMCERGHVLVADDIAALRSGSDGAAVYPAYPQLKLWPDAAASLGEDPDALPRLDPVSGRRAHRDIQRFPSRSLPLRRIYVLCEGESLGVESLRPQEALMELIRHTYGRELFQAVDTREHFFRCAGVVNCVPVCALKRPRSLAVLPEVVRLVEGDVQPVPALS